MHSKKAIIDLHCFHLKVAAKAATCTETGNTEYWKCEDCGKLFSDQNGSTEITEADTVTDKIAHTPGAAVKDNVVAATCETAGSYEEVVKCTVCKTEISRTEKTIAALGHDWGEWETTKEATPTEEGEQTRVCQNDNTHKQTRAIPVTTHVHSIVAVEEVPATCTTDGKKAHYKCSECGLLFEDEAGTTMITDEQALIIKAGHTASEAVKENVVNSTCEVTGSYEEVVKCSVCGEEISRTMKTTTALGHDYKEVAGSAKAATCTSAGKESDKKCSRCNAIVEGKVIAALGHKWGEWKTTKNPTETEEGIEERVCGNDATHKETRSIAKLAAKPVTDSTTTTTTTPAAPATAGTTVTDTTSSATYTVTSEAATGHLVITLEQ